MFPHDQAAWCHSEIGRAWICKNHTVCASAYILLHSALLLLSLHNNKVYELHPDTSNSLHQQLTHHMCLLCRFLMNTQITSLPEGVFQGLSSLQILWADSHRAYDLYVHICMHMYLYFTHIFTWCMTCRNIGGNSQLSSLPEGIFKDLSMLQSL